MTTSGGIGGPGGGVEGVGPPGVLRGRGCPLSLRPFLVAVLAGGVSPGFGAGGVASVLGGAPSMGSLFGVKPFAGSSAIRRP